MISQAQQQGDTHRDLCVSLARMMVYPEVLTESALLLQTPSSSARTRVKRDRIWPLACPRRR